MSISRTFIKASVALALTSVVFATSAFGQSPAATPNRTAAVSEPKPGSAENRVAAENGKPKDLLSEIEAMKTENAAVWELLRRMDEQQKLLLEQVDRLQRRLDGGPALVVSAAPDVSNVGLSIAPPTPPDFAEPAPPQASEERFRDGMVLWQTSETAKVPFLVKFNVNTQLRYLNTLSSEETFTDHLGVVRDVHARNDITVNRAMFVLGGYVFDPRLRYSFTVWTSAGAASIVIAGNIGWQFNKALAITGGYTGVPGSRSLVATFPFFAAIDRSMADNFFRPGFTQGVWANGEFGKGLNYLAFVGNGLNTLNISASKIDTHLVGIRQYLVGTARALRGTRQVTQHVR